jgi:predicted secreted protein
MAGTAAKKLRGYEGQAYYTLGTGTKKKMSHITDLTIDVKADTIDFSDHDTDGWKDNGSGLKEFSGSATLNKFTNDLTQDDLFDALSGAVDLSIDFRQLDAVTETNYTGTINITGYSMKSPNSGAQTIDITFIGRGALVRGAIVAP